MTEAPDRRRFLLATAVALAAPGAALAAPGAALAADAYAASPFRKISDAQWRQRLPGAAYRILRHEDTEPPGTSALLKEKRKGTYACLGCGLALFRSDTKYESG